MLTYLEPNKNSKEFLFSQFLRNYSVLPIRFYFNNYKSSCIVECNK